MLLAGGQGSRLYVLTKNVAKPAVPFGGKYRIIDFPLSNCINSGIDTVGVLTQYEPHVLNAYIGSGPDVGPRPPARRCQRPASVSARQGFRVVQRARRTQFIRISSLSRIMIRNMFSSCPATTSTRWTTTRCSASTRRPARTRPSRCSMFRFSEASRFGIMNCKPDGTIYEFEEKPKEPKSTLASMGIYIFSWKKLRKYLEEDEANSKSSNDFGKDIIPAMLANGEKMVSYRFEGYWKDVGTIESLWEANMDLLSPNSGLNLSDDSWKIYGRTTGSPPHFTAKGAKVQHTLLSEGCEIAGNVSESVLFSDVKVAKNANVEYSILMPGAVVEEGANVRYAIVASGAVIAKGASIGAGPSECDVDKWGVAVVAENVRIGENVKLAAKEMADEDIPDAE